MFFIHLRIKNNAGTVQVLLSPDCFFVFFLNIAYLLCLCVDSTLKKGPLDPTVYLKAILLC